MNNLTFTLVVITKKSKSGSIKTRADRFVMVKRFGDALASAFPGLEAKNLKPMHVLWFVEALREGRLSDRGKPPSAGTVKNQLSAVRWILARLGKPNLLPADNRSLGIAARCYLPSASRAIYISDDELRHIRRINPRFAASFFLMREFGLRLEESLKVIPCIADHASELALKGSWCKNGRPRVIPIINAAQRDALDNAHCIAGEASLVAPETPYISARRALTAFAKSFGISRVHGLRHAYAQRRFAEIAGFAPPLAGGPIRAEMTEAQRAADARGRKIVSEELGHGRPQISTVYLGTATPRVRTADEATADIAALIG